MSRPRVILVRSGVKKLLNSPEAADCVSSLGRDMARRAGAGYAAEEPHKTGQRVAVNVHAETWEARRDNQENNTLLKAVGPPVL